MEVGISVTAGAKGDEVWLGIVAQTAAQVEVMNLEFGRMPAVLAAPAVPLQHLLAELVVRFWVEAEAWAVWEKASHEAFLNCSKNCRCCGGGRN